MLASPFAAGLMCLPARMCVCFFFNIDCVSLKTCIRDTYRVRTSSCPTSHQSTRVLKYSEYNLSPISHLKPSLILLAACSLAVLQSCSLAVLQYV